MDFCLNCRKKIEVPPDDNHDFNQSTIQCNTCGLSWPIFNQEQNINMPALEATRLDNLIATLKGVTGIIPGGSILGELLGATIPNQRMDRIVKFAIVLENRIQNIEKKIIIEQIKNELFVDLIEEAVRQAAHSQSHERRKYIASLIANSLSAEQIEYHESKYLLKLLDQINDVEVIHLRYYLRPTLGGDDEFREKHNNVLRPIMAPIGGPQDKKNKKAFQESYRKHLVDIGLLRAEYGTYSLRQKEMVGSNLPDPQIKVGQIRSLFSDQQIKIDPTTGTQEISGYHLTRLGKILLKNIDLYDQDISLNKDFE